MLRWRTSYLLVLALCGCQAKLPLTNKQALAEAAFASEPVAKSASTPVATAPLVAAPRLEAVRREPRMDIAVDRVPVQAFIQGLAQHSQYNLVLHPQLTGDISLNLKQVSLPELLELLRDLYGYDYRRIGNTFQLLPAEPRTLVIPVDYLNLQRSGISRTLTNWGQLGNNSGGSGSSNSGSSSSGSNSGSNGSAGSSTTGTEILTQSRSDVWQELQHSLELIVGTEGGQQVVVSPQTSSVVVRALPAGLRAVKEYLDNARLSLGRQVVLEAKILEVTLDEGFQAGIDWQGLITRGESQLTLSQAGAVPLAPPSPGGGVFGMTLTRHDFQGVIRLLESQGQVQVLSSPRVSTLNNQKAVIKVGTDEFFVTGVSSTTTSVGASTQVSPDLDLTPFFSGIALDVTPQIAEDGDIRLHVHPTVSRVQDQVKTVTLGNDQFVLPLAFSSIRESDSIVRARSGQLIVIGGLMQQDRFDDNAKAPWLADIPLVGKLFTQTKRGQGKSDLVILLRPWLVDDQGQQQWLEQVSAPLLKR